MESKDDSNRPYPDISIRDTSPALDPLITHRYEAHRARTPPTAISSVNDPGRAANHQAKGIRAPRSRPAVTGLFPGSSIRLVGQTAVEDEQLRRSTSHELSFHPNNARDSLVNQILMSLDSPPAAFQETDAQDRPRSSSKGRRTRGHTYSSSTSSGFVQYVRDRSSSRGRHSKNKSSGSNLRTTLDRIKSVHQRDPEPTSENDRTLQRLAAQGWVRDRSADSSAQRRAPRRSISFDQARSGPLFGSGRTLRQGTMDSEQVSDYEGLEAARPTSPSSGPRWRDQNDLAGPINAQSLRPGRRDISGLRRPGTSPQRSGGGLDNAMQGADDAGDETPAPGRTTRVQAPPVPATVRHKATHSNSYKATAFSTNATVGKERGGFFKRMFGSNSKTPATGAPEVQASPQAPQASSSIRSGSQQGQSDEKTATMNQGPATATRATASPAPKSEPKEPATLNKKSSFFRRRKKSIAVPAPPIPTLPSSTAWQENTPSRDHSPASSLRKVMNPYLANSRPGTRTGRAASKLDASEVPSPAGEVLLYPMQDAGRAFGSESSHAHPQSTSNQRSANRDSPDKENLKYKDHPVTSGSYNDLSLQGAEGEERASRRKTVTAANSSGSAPTRSSSKGWRDRPQNRVYPSDQSRRSTSAPRRPGIVRTETDASEVSDSDFTSAKSQVMSPTDDKESELSRPPLPPAAPPAIPSMTISTSAAANADKDDRPLLTSETARPEAGGRFTTLDPAGPPAHSTHDSVAAITPESLEQKPSDEDYATADQLFRFNPDVTPDDPSLPRNADDICPWLGEAGEERALVRKAYLEMFNWQDVSVLTALRKFCEHVKLKGETQQVDRVLEGIARRWTECNTSHGFKAVDVVHTICYSLLLLNTDLHVADIENRMTRSQFVKNTMQTVLRVVDDAAPDAFKQATINAAKRASMLPPPRPAPLDLSKQGNLSAGAIGVTSPQSPHSPNSPRESGTVKLSIRRNSNEFQKRDKFRLSARPSDNSALETLLGEAARKAETPSALANEDCGPLVKQPFFGGKAAWETQIEIVLKNFYGDIQKQRLPLQGSDTLGNRDTSRAPSSLGGHNPPSNRVGRSASISSRQSGGERGRESRPTTGTTSRWRNKINRPRIYAASNFSVDDDMSMTGISPSASSMWSKHSIGRTQTSMSVTSLRSEAPGHEAYQQSIGFANALSQAIIREEHAADGEDLDEKDGEAIKASSLLDDDSLELYGAPWAKEGIVKHKHHLESVDKKAKERAWTECFAVIQKGWLQLFRFNPTKSLRARALRAAVGGVSNTIGGGSKGVPGPGGKVIVGGGNWMDNALPLGRFLLRQSIASSLPPPGYSKSRPHVWALSLPNGAVHLFQAGTPEIVREYVTCANYWSARLSKEPLVGGVSNVEYGWSEGLLNNAIIAARPGSRNDGAPSSMAEALAMSRQRSGSSDTSAAPAPGVPRTSSRSVSGPNRPPSAMHSARPSLQNSIRNSIDTTASAAVRPRLPGDHARIAEWSPPQQSMVASALMEVDQLRVLTDYVTNIKNELEKHNELRPAIQLAYGSRHPNFSKAMSNFEKKSAYLLREIVKFSTYIEILQTAQTKKDEVLKERDDRKKEMDAERAKDDAEKVETAEELRRELSRSDLRIAALASSGELEDVPDVPALPEGGGFTKS